jgi:hypothetical protein
MGMQELDREEQWIAKYRAALDRCPQQPSVFHHLALSWPNGPKFTRLSLLAFGHFRHAIDCMQSLKIWLTARSLQILWPGKRESVVRLPLQDSIPTTLSASTTDMKLNAHGSSST